jgi:cytoskeletal protein CcmA (bactofilin family)
VEPSGDITLKLTLDLTGKDGNFETTGKLVVGLAGSITGDIICNNADIEEI